MMLTARAILSLIPFALLLGTFGCERKIGPPNDQEELLRAENVISFDRLYKQNCSACHGERGTEGPALDLANPEYQALVDDMALKRWIAAHSHRDDRVATVISGTWRIGYGDRFDESKLKALPPGSYYTEPPGQTHFAETGDEPVVVQITGFGPSSTDYVDPASDPRNSHGSD
jgi:quercetin dioxygenase-like cupin family protein